MDNQQLITITIQTHKDHSPNEVQAIEGAVQHVLKQSITRPQKEVFYGTALGSIITAKSGDLEFKVSENKAECKIRHEKFDVLMESVRAIRTKRENMRCLASELLEEGVESSVVIEALDGHFCESHNVIAKIVDKAERRMIRNKRKSDEQE